MHPITPRDVSELSYKDREKARKLCIEALYLYQYKNHTPSYILSLEWIIGSNLPKAEVLEYYKFLFLGSIAHQAESDKLIYEFAHKHEQEYLFKIDRAILQFAIFSLLYEKEVPSVVVINEAIKLAKIYSGTEGYKFINGVLDGVYKNSSSTERL